MSITRRHPPDPMGCILAVALRPDAAPPRDIRIRPELATRLGPHWADYANRPHAIGGITITIDPRLPRYPGFEVHRQPPERTPR